MLLPLVIADQSAGGLAKPAEGAGDDAETRSFPKGDFQVVRTFSRRRLRRRRSNEPTEPYIRSIPMRPFMQPSPEIEARIEAEMRLKDTQAARFRRTLAPEARTTNSRL